MAREEKIAEILKLAKMFFVNVGTPEEVNDFTDDELNVELRNLNNRIKFP